MNTILTFCKASLLEEFNRGVSITATIYGVALFIIYLIAIKKKYGWLQSISISFYKVRWLFQAFMYTEAFSIILIAQCHFYTIASLCFVIMAMFPSVLYKHFIIPHCIFASLAIFLMTIGIFLFNSLLALIGCIFVIVMLAIILLEVYVYENSFIKNTLVYWIEIITLSNIIIMLILTRVVA